MIPGTHPAAGPGPVLRLRRASFGYADQVVLADADLSVHTGEVIAVLGPNGSGKSTLMRGILGLNDHLGGQVRIFGQPLGQLRDPWRLGYVPQRHTLSISVRASVQEIVAVGRLPRQRWWRPTVRSAADLAAINHALDVVGLSDRTNADVSTLSGGQHRRVLIARALASQPEVLLMDEPTAGVDAANQQVLTAVLGRLAAAGTTMVIVTHELAALRDLVTRVVVIQAGRVAFDGTPQELAARTHEYAPDYHHHHDDDGTLRRSVHLPGAPTTGPLDPGQVRS